MSISGRSSALLGYAFQPTRAWYQKEISSLHSRTRKNFQQTKSVSSCSEEGNIYAKGTYHFTKWSMFLFPYAHSGPPESYKMFDIGLVIEWERIYSILRGTWTNMLAYKVDIKVSVSWVFVVYEFQKKQEIFPRTTHPNVSTLLHPLANWDHIARSFSKSR